MRKFNWKSFQLNARIIYFFNVSHKAGPINSADIASLVKRVKLEPFYTQINHGIDHVNLIIIAIYDPIALEISGN